MALEGGLYSQVVMLRISIMKTKATKEDLTKYKEKINESSKSSQIEDDNENYCASSKDKVKKRTSEATEESKKGEKF